MKDDFSDAEQRILASVRKNQNKFARSRLDSPKLGLWIVLGFGLSVPLLLWLSTKSPWLFRLLQASQHTQTSGAIQTHSSVEGSTVNELTIKGLYIGMSVSRLGSVVESKFQGDWRVVTNDSGDQYDITSFSVTSREISQRGFPEFQGVAVKFNSFGQVTAFRIQPDAANELFNAESLGAGAFVQMFVNSYNIPKMDWEDGCWQFRTNQTRVRITSQKEIYVDKVPALESVQRNFD